MLHERPPPGRTWWSRFWAPARRASRCDVPGLRKPLGAFRIGDARGAYEIFSGEGSRHNPGRWHKTGQPMIYASEHYSTAMLEKLVRLGEMPPNHPTVEDLVWERYLVEEYAPGIAIRCEDGDVVVLGPGAPAKPLGEQQRRGICRAWRLVGWAWALPIRGLVWALRAATGWPR